MDPFIYRPVMSMNGVNEVLIIILVNRRTDRGTHFIHRPSMARKSWTYLILLLRVEVVVDVALDNALLLLGVFTDFILFVQVLKITSLDFDVL